MNQANASSKSDVQSLVTQSAQAHNVPVALALGTAHVESSFRCDAMGLAREVGPMQIKPATARGVGYPVTRASSCADKVEASMRYLKQALTKAGGDWCRGASFYNRGLYARPTCSSYGRKVVAAAKRYGAAA